MNSDIAIKVEHLTKIYNTRNLILDENGVESNEFYALKDVSFEIKKGESVGIIGANGSGKSTLLKILAGVTKPTSGKVTINGKVASILDIGAGFHPELSGRENVFLNGQIHGFSKKEIEEKFDEIVEFSGIKKFIDEPVKNYSNGMYLRLAFSIMAHLDFDVYLLDEVLSVGDQDFKNVSLRKIESLHQNKKTILIVSHNLQELYRLDIYMKFEFGIMKKILHDNKTLNEYVEKVIEQDKKKLNEVFLDGQGEINFNSNQKACLDLEVKKVSLFQKNNSCDFIKSNLPLEIELEIFKKKDIDSIDVLISLSDIYDNIVFITSPFIKNGFENETSKGIYQYKLTIPKNFLYSTTYFVNFYFFKNCMSLFSKVAGINVENLLDNPIIEISYSLNQVAKFKTRFFVSNKTVNLNDIKLHTNLFLGLNWEKIYK